MQEIGNHEPQLVTDTGNNEVWIFDADVGANKSAEFVRLAKAAQKAVYYDGDEEELGIHFEQFHQNRVRLERIGRAQVSLERESYQGQNGTSLHTFAKIHDEIDLEVGSDFVVHHCRTKSRVWAQTLAQGREDGDEAFDHVENRVHEHVGVHAVLGEELLFVLLLIDDQDYEQVEEEPCG